MTGFNDIKTLAELGYDPSVYGYRDKIENTMPESAEDGVFNTLKVGSGSLAFSVDAQGLWLGADSYDDAPFKVDMAGNAILTSVTVSGYIQAGGAANDINTNITTVDGDMITANTITATQILANTITADQIAANTITATEIAANTITATEIAANTITADQIVAGTITSDELATNSIIADKITANSITTTKINDSAVTNTKIGSGAVSNSKLANLAVTNAKVNDLSADKLTAGTIYVGYTGRPGTIVLNRNGTNGYLTWTGGNKIWSDGSQYMGFTANGERFYFYTGAVLYALFQRGSQASFYSGVNVSGNLNVSGTARIDSTFYADGWIYTNRIYNLDYLVFDEVSSTSGNANAIFFRGGDLRIKLRGTEYKVDLSAV